MYPSAPIEILGIEMLPDGGANLILPGNGTALVGPDWLAQQQPQIGGYIVAPAAESVWIALPPAPRPAEIARLSLKPGDTLLISAPGNLTREQRHALHMQAAAVVPADVTIVFKEPGVEYSVIEAPAPVAIPPEITEISRLSLRAGDTLVFTHPDDMSLDAVGRVLAELNKMTPEGVIVMGKPKRMELSVVEAGATSVEG